MRIYVAENVLVDGTWYEPGEHPVTNALGEHLVRLGVARNIENFEAKINPPTEFKKKPLTNAGLSSQAAPASQKKTRKSRKNSTA